MLKWEGFTNIPYGAQVKQMLISVLIDVCPFIKILRLDTVIIKRNCYMVCTRFNAEINKHIKLQMNAAYYLLTILLPELFSRFFAHV